MRGDRETGKWKGRAPCLGSQEGGLRGKGRDDFFLFFFFLREWGRKGKVFPPSPRLDELLHPAKRWSHVAVCVA